MRHGMYSHISCVLYHDYLAFSFLFNLGTLDPFSLSSLLQLFLLVCSVAPDPHRTPFSSSRFPLFFLLPILHFSVSFPIYLVMFVFPVLFCQLPLFPFSFILSSIFSA